jgi:predicted dinucleotide-binding enzyme
VQIALGALTVIAGNPAPTVAAHLIAGVAMLGGATVTAVCALMPAPATPLPRLGPVGWVAIGTAGVLFVSGSLAINAGAEQACPSFPLCPSEQPGTLVWPHQLHRGIAVLGSLCSRSRCGLAALVPPMRSPRASRNARRLVVATATLGVVSALMKTPPALQDLHLASLAAVARGLGCASDSALAYRRRLPTGPARGRTADSGAADGIDRATVDPRARPAQDAAWQAEPMGYVVFGAGSIGAVVGGRLFQAGCDVTLIACGGHLQALQARGLRLESPASTGSVRLAAVGHPREIDWHTNQVVLVAVKSQQSLTALCELAEVAPPETPIVCLQNGIANEPAALRMFPNVYGVSVACPTSHLEPGVVQAWSTAVTGLLDFGRYPTGIDRASEAVAADLRAATFSSRPVEDIPAGRTVSCSPTSATPSRQYAVRTSGRDRWGTCSWPRAKRCCPPRGSRPPPRKKTGTDERICSNSGTSQARPARWVFMAEPAARHRRHRDGLPQRRDRAPWPDVRGCDTGQRAAAATGPRACRHPRRAGQDAPRDNIGAPRPCPESRSFPARQKVALGVLL